MILNTLIPSLLCGTLLAQSALSKPTPFVPVESGLSRRASCGDNGPTNRACWKDSWDINTDYETTTPPGTTRTFDLTITNVTSFSPDGVEKRVMLINGVYPGPTLEADWGDTLQITVHNQLSDNGTSFHWHGFRQLKSGDQDGVNGVTECPIPPGGSKTYTFKATQYGTSWYHSHFSVQYGNGVVGTIKINGPASADYDIDLGPFPISDWYHETADLTMLKAEQATGPPPPSSNILFNGSNINPLAGGSGGGYRRVTLTPGKKHLLRIVNTAVENHFTVSLVGHTFTVIATDFVPVKPVVRDQLFLAVGQRYDVIIDASQEVDNYWFNATMATSGLCGATLNKEAAAIFSYDGAPGGSGATPTNPGPAIHASCDDDDTTGFTPIVARHPSQSDFASHLQQLDINLTTVVSSRGSIFRWTVNSNAVDVQWDKPTLQYVLETNTSYPAAANVIPIDGEGEWTFVVLDNIAGLLPHPIHLHGHDFLVLGSGAKGNFDPATDTALLNFDNPTRRDVAILPGGWLVIAFRVDNPGAWLLHCHIAWHVSQGLSVQFLELAAQIPGAYDLGGSLAPVCDAWRGYEGGGPAYGKLDSGL